MIQIRGFLKKIIGVKLNDILRKQKHSVIGTGNHKFEHWDNNTYIYFLFYSLFVLFIYFSHAESLGNILLAHWYYVGKDLTDKFEMDVE